jgi:hypothetical protein
MGELEELTSESISLLLDEAYHGVVRPEVVVTQLQSHDQPLFLFFYLRGLWKGGSNGKDIKMTDAALNQGRLLAEEFADLIVELFAEYDRKLLLEFLKASQSYTFEKVRCDYLLTA